VWSSTSAIFGWPNGKRRNEVRTRRGVTEFAKLAKAISTFRRALEIDPRSPAAHLALGDALLRAGQAAPAVTELKAAAALSPGMRQVYTLLARAYQKLGRTEEARHALQIEQGLAQEEIRSRGTNPSSEERFPARPENPPPAESLAPKY
jgi:tetratricopeptide (TPR) repeat protein